MTETHPLKSLTVSDEVFDDILGRLQAAGAEDAIITAPDGTPVMLDMHGLGLVRAFLHKGPGDGGEA